MRNANKEVVLRLLRGESLDQVSREIQVPAHDLETWHRRFLQGGQRGLRTKADPEERELTLAKAKLGALMMRLELAELLIESRGLMDESKAMTGQVSPSMGRPYSRTWLYQVWHVARSRVYATTPRPDPARPLGKRGPKTPVPHAVLLEAIRAVLAACPFYGEGYREVRARLAHRGLAVGGKRVLRLMRQHSLLAQRRLGHPHGDPAHTGTIVTDRPDVLWGTDATRFYTAGDGWCWFFWAIDHGTDEIVGWHATKIGDRWAALEPLRQTVRHAFGGFGKEIARGLTLRCDWGPQYTADGWIGAVRWLGMTISPSYVGEPECNGVIERFLRTLKEQCLYLHQFTSLVEARRVIGDFIHRYNTEWLIGRLGYRTPAAARAAAWAEAA